MKLKKYNEEFYLHMGTVLVDPLSKIVNTTFIFILENIKKENQVCLVEAFWMLSKMFKMEEFSSVDAVVYPNVVVEEMANLNSALVF